MLFWLLIAVGGFLLVVLIYDLAQKHLPILRNFPIIGHLRYFLIRIGPELRQYIIAHNREEAHFNMEDIELSAGPGIFKTLKELYGYNKAPAA